MKIRKPNRGDYLFFIVLITFISIMIYRIIYEKEVNKNENTTIAKVYDIEITRYAVKNILFKYKYKNKVYYGTKKVDSHKANEYLNKYYKVSISFEEPDKYIIHLDNQIIDSSEVKNSDLR